MSAMGHLGGRFGPLPSDTGKLALASVERFVCNGDHEFVIRPNCSLSWKGAKRYLALQSGVVLLAMTPLVWMGAWLVLPIAGIELIVLTAAFYWVLLQAHRIEVVTIEGKQVLVRRGRRAPEEEATYPRGWVQVVLKQATTGPEKSRLFLRAYGQATEVAAALTNSEKERFAEELTQALDRGQRLERNAI